MSSKGPKRRTYWLADEITAELRDRALLLNQKGYDVHFFNSLESLSDELAVRRAGVLVVSDDFDEKVIERILISLMSRPEAQGARMVMVRSKVSESVNVLAGNANFRDIIPADLDTRAWLTRFIYATAGKPMPYVQPVGQVSLNDITGVSLPARLTWLSSTQVRFECRVRPPVGAALKLRGPLAAAAGVPAISLVVVETQRSHLLYRFSDAAIAEWHVPAAAAEKLRAALADLARQDPGPRCRIFVAVQTPELRAQVLLSFEDPRFELASALQKQNIVDEPRFFTPDVVVIEDALCLGDNGERFAAMMGNLSEHTTVIVIGHLPYLAEVQKAWPKQRVIQFAKLPSTLASSVLNRYMPVRQTQREAADKTGTNISNEHRFSRGEVSFGGRLQRLHPHAAQLALPFPVGNFAVCRVESPMLKKLIGRHPYLKLTTTYQDTRPGAAPFVHLAEGYFADLHPAEQKALGTGLIQALSISLTQDHNGFISPKTSGGEARMTAGDVRPGGASPVATPTGAEVQSLPLDELAIDSAALVKEAFAAPSPRALPDITAAPAVAATAAAPTAATLPVVPIAAPVKIEVPKPKAKPKRKKANAIDAKMAVTALIVVVLVGGAFVAGLTLLSKHVEKSGGTYSEQLQKFQKAPP